MFTITTISHPSLRSNSPSLAPPWVITLCLPPLLQYWLTLSHPSLSTNSVRPPSLKIVQNMVQKMVQKIVQSIFYPMPRKSNPLQTRVFFFHLDRLVERWGGRHNIEQSCQRQRKNRQPGMEKPEKVLRSKTTNRHTAFKITIFEAIVHVFASRLALE